MQTFIPGRILSQDFFHEVAAPILQAHYPALVYSAGLLGYGSDVLGYDDETSTDHMWGPRFYLFLSEEDTAIAEGIMAHFRRGFPYTYKGYSVNFSVPDPADGGVRVAEHIDSGEVSPLIFIQTFEDFLREYLGSADLAQIDILRWLTFPEHRLLALASGTLFVDGLGVAERLEAVRAYPLDVARYLVASQWALIGEEQAFVTRTGKRGDEIGAHIICARIVERLMRLCFLYTRTYAPYSKWFGTAFTWLPIDPAIGDAIQRALTASTVEDREQHLIAAKLHVVELHNQCEWLAPVEAKVENYFTREIQVIYADRIAEVVMAQVTDERLRSAPRIGTMSQIGNFVALSDNPQWQRQIEQLYCTMDVDCKG
jgi:hypothetical protein